MKRWTAQGFAALPGSVRGALWMVLSAVLFTLATATVRHLTQHMHFVEISFFRALFGLMVFAPWFWRRRAAAFRTRRTPLYLARGVTSVSAMFLWFGALALMPIADATAISFAQPLFVSVAAVLFLAEPMRASRWAGLAVGFAGTLIVLRPGFAEVNVGALMVLGAALFIAASAVLVKVAGRDDPPEMIAMYQVLYMLPLTFFPALFVWTWPGWEALFWAVMVGVLSTFAQLALTRAYIAGDASAITPFDFTRLVFAAALGFVLFAELPDLPTVLGGVVIFASSLIVVRGEARARRADRRPTPSRSR